MFKQSSNFNNVGAYGKVCTIIEQGVNNCDRLLVWQQLVHVSREVHTLMNACIYYYKYTLFKITKFSKLTHSQVLNYYETLSGTSHTARG